MSVLWFIIVSVALDISYYNMRVSATEMKIRRSTLAYPPSSVFQITLGISVEGDLDKNMVGFGLALQHNANLPGDTQTFFLPQIVSLRAFSLYNHLRELISSYGFHGLECLKKMICQISETPLKGGVLEEIINFILTPSNHENGLKREESSVQSNNNHILNALLESEGWGKTKKNCTLIYILCDKSPLDMITYLEKV